MPTTNETPAADARPPCCKQCGGTGTVTAYGDDGCDGPARFGHIARCWACKGFGVVNMKETGK